MKHIRRNMSFRTEQRAEGFLQTEREIIIALIDFLITSYEERRLDLSFKGF